MELKFNRDAFLDAETFRFNRTFMELKLLIKISSNVGTTSFNRTFMELKWLSGEHMSVGKVVLIVPLWN